MCTYLEREKMMYDNVRPGLNEKEQNIACTYTYSIQMLDSVLCIRKYVLKYVAKMYVHILRHRKSGSTLH